MSIDLTQLLRLEIERDPDPGELINLVPNPDGDLGAWGWETPVAGSNLVSDSTFGRGLAYTSPGGVASYFYTEALEVSAGEYVAANWVSATVDGAYKVRVDWLDSTKAVISSTAYTANLSFSSSIRTIGPFLAPSGAIYARLRFDHLTSSGGNPGAGTMMIVRNVAVTAAATAAALAWSRVNLVTNPSAETSTAGWEVVGGDLSRSAGTPPSGTYRFEATKTGSKGDLVATTPIGDVEGGRDYATLVSLRPGSNARPVKVEMLWYGSGGKLLKTSRVRTTTETDGAWAAVSGVVTAPTNAATAAYKITWSKVPPGETHRWDAVLVEQASTVGTYFDGSTTGTSGETYGWSGTPHASTSIGTGAPGNLGVVVPVAYQNILGSAGQITIDREDLNVGSMSVRLFDAILDPTQNDLIQTGKRIRLTSIDPDTGAGETLFAGKVFTGAVTYHLLEADEHKRAEVNLTAVDPINALAATSRREGVATIAELPYVLEGAGVPWSVNGNGNQVATAEVVAYNDNASVLDQVAVTRDSVLGYAWVDRNGVLQAWDRDLLDGTVADVLDKATYNTDLDIGVDTDAIINSVTVQVLHVVATSGATEEVSFGPYVDQDSYRVYGEHSQEYTVQGFDVDDTAAIQDYAEQILAANAEPKLKVNTLVLPIAGPGIDTPATDRARLDLYDLVTVSNDRAGLDDNLRIQTISHEITATATGGTWLMTVGFSSDGSVASSTATPSPSPGVGAVKDDIEVVTGSLQADLDYLNDVTLPGVASDLAGLNGLFPVTGTNIANDAISTPKLVANAVSSEKVVAYAITGDKIAANAIGADKIIANSIGAGHLAADAITSKTITGCSINGGSLTISGVCVINSGGVVFQSSNFSVFGSGTVSFAGGISAGGQISSATSVVTGTAEVGTLLAGSVVSSGNVNADDYYASNQTGSGAQDAEFGASGNVHRKTSSRRFKENIEPLPLETAKLLLALQAVSFNYKDRESYGDGRYPGAIAEEVAEAGLDLWVTRDEEGLPNGIRYAELVMPLIQLVNDLTARVEALEAS